jgi:S1-C subfamily serine protease
VVNSFILRKLLLVSLVFANSICVFPQNAADLRKYIAVVEALTMGGATLSFGSGWLWIDPRNSDSYVLTCEHVIRSAHSLDVSFLKKGAPASEKETLEDVEALHREAETDLAMLYIGRYFDSGFKISLAEPLEAITEVFAAGYPALGLIFPSYQLTRGFITNSAVNLGKTELLQHSAAIAPASSGGPLLAPSSPNADMAVIGVNSSVGRGRADASFAVPGPVVAKFIIEALQKSDPAAVWETGENDSIESAVAIMLDSEINGALYPRGDVDFYRIPYSKEPRELLVSCKGGDGFLLDITDEKGNAVPASSDGANLKFNAGSLALYVRIKQKDFFLFDVYSLQVSEYEPKTR